MSNPITAFYFDFVDPLSYLLELVGRAADGSSPAGVDRVGFEVVPPPRPLTTVDDPVWSLRYQIARPLASAAGVALAPPSLVPWTRKAHELHHHAREVGAVGKADEVRLAIFEAYFARGEDIGRIDRLVAIAAACGLDPAAARTVLGVDRHEEDVVAARAAAAAAGIDEVPALAVAGRVLRGFHNRADLLVSSSVGCRGAGRPHAFSHSLVSPSTTGSRMAGYQRKTALSPHDVMEQAARLLPEAVGLSRTAGSSHDATYAGAEGTLRLEAHRHGPYTSVVAQTDRLRTSRIDYEVQRFLNHLPYEPGDRGGPGSGEPS